MDQTIAIPLIVVSAIVIVGATVVLYRRHKTRLSDRQRMAALARWQAAETHARSLASSGRSMDIESWVAEMNARFLKVLP